MNYSELFSTNIGAPKSASPDPNRTRQKKQDVTKIVAYDLNDDLALSHERTISTMTTITHTPKSQ